MNTNFIIMTLLLQGSLFGMGCGEDLPLREDAHHQTSKTVREMAVETIARNEKQFSDAALKELPAELRAEVIAKRKECRGRPYLFACL